MIIFRVVYVLRIITVCLIILLVLDYFLKWNIIKSIADYNRDILITGAVLFIVVYLIASWIMIFVRFKYMNRRPPKPITQEDDKVS